ncbi:MAG TPA: ferritin-like domain-containing protein [Acidimicrobiales bacterium]|nr:ferritin-like domain-containing protein [Acidimicrobiales bacterium]
MARTVSPAIENVTRDPALKAVDASAVRAVAQAAINVELFTIPLYMGALYSIQGMHQITSKGSSFYKGRLWPGAAVTAPRAGVDPALTPNEEAFNIIFSVFIEEMLHLQMASNIATMIGVRPSFTSSILQDPQHGWTCYGPDVTVIPHIVNLQDVPEYSDLRVNIAALTADQVRLFLVIEQPEAQALAALGGAVNASVTVPFPDWKITDTDLDLPMFGTIGTMYQCYLDYLNVQYADGTRLWDYVWNPTQKDLFNVINGGHTKAEYPGFATTFGDAAEAYSRAVDMMDAITDQGEGSILQDPPTGALTAVEAKYQADKDALEVDYVSYSDTGKKLDASATAAARTQAGAEDHYERFGRVQALLDAIITWPQWFASGRTWQASDLQAGDYDPNDNPHDLPTTEAVAAALNALASTNRDQNKANLDKVATGAIAGVTTVLDTYWTTPNAQFPWPSMGGSGDRMAICWAVFGEAPVLATMDQPEPGILYHACQGLALSGPSAACAPSEVFHTCKGSNGCKAQGGCGFVQATTGGGTCGFPPPPPGPTLFSAPGDNKCATFGGCAVPISAAQLFPGGGKMELFDFQGSDQEPNPFGTIDFNEGDKVHDVAYRAYLKVMEHRGEPVPDGPAPPPSDLRLVFPPST